jgi:hypothetical protein
VLISARDGLHVAGIGARVDLDQCLFVVGQDALRLDPGSAARGRLNIQCFLDHVTVAARRAVVRLADAPHLSTGVEPMVVQSHTCALLNPFTGTQGKGTASAGLLLWQGEGDFTDQRLMFQAVAAQSGEVPQLREPQPRVVWAHLWGPLGDRQPAPEAVLRQTLDLEKLQLERLALPPSRLKPGADLLLLGIGKKR